jgi:hypothetical protein
VNPLIAQQAASGIDPIMTLVQYGALGLVVIALLAGWLWAKPAVEQLRRDKDKAEAQRDKLIELMTTQVIPVIGDSVRATGYMSDVAERMVRFLDDDRYAERGPAPHRGGNQRDRGPTPGT